MQKIGFIALFLIFSAFSSTILCQEQPKEKQNAWLDDMHENISFSVMSTAKWFDDFFANERQQEDSEAKGEARIRLGWEPRTRELDEFEARVRVRVKLPKLKNRVDLILSGDDDEFENKVRAGREEDINRQDTFNVALRYQAKPDSGISHRIGFGRRFQYYAKSRYRGDTQISDKTELLYDASVYYYNRDKWGTDAGLTLDYQTSQQLLLRVNGRAYFRDKTDDWLLQQSWQALHQINDKSAIVYGIYIEGISRPNYQTTEYLTSIKLRQNALREWLFYEVEPFILWRRDEQFSASYGIALRVEGFFGKR